MASSPSISCRFSHGAPSIFFLSSKIRRSGGGLIPSRSFSMVTALVVKASTSVDSYESSSEFVKRMEQAWIISKQPRPIACSTCESNGHVDCKWCSGTGFFILGNNMLCEVPSKNTSCIICAGKRGRSRYKTMKTSTTATIYYYCTEDHEARHEGLERTTISRAKAFLCRYLRRT